MTRDILTLADTQDGEQDDREMGRAPANRMPAPKRSGTTWTEADYRAAGYGTVKLRLPESTIALMGILAHEAGLSRAEYVASLLDAADLEHARRHAEGALSKSTAKPRKTEQAR